MVEELTNPILLVALPLFFVFLSVIIASFNKKIVKYIPVVSFAANLLVLISLSSKVLSQGIVLSFTAGLKPPLSINLAVDKLSFLLAFLTNFLAFAISIYNVFYIKERLEDKFHILFMILGLSTTWLIITGDLFNLFVAFEIVSVSSFSLVAFTREKESVEAGFKYLILGNLAGVLLLIGVILVYTSTGTLNMADIALKISSLTLSQKVIPFLFIFTGLAVEGALFPLNSWLPDAHPSAPSGISAFLSGIVTTSAIYGIVRVVITVFNFPVVPLAFVILGLVTLIYGEIAAFYQKDIKRMLAFSTIGQTGLIFLTFFAGGEPSISASLMQVLNHSLSKAILFLVAGSMVLKVGSRDIEGLKGLGFKMRGSAVVFIVAVLSLVGIPPFFGFFSKVNILTSLLSESETSSLLFLVIPILFFSIIEAAYFFKVIKILFTRTRDTYPSENYRLLLPALIILAALILISAFPNQVLAFMKETAHNILQRDFYIRSVIGGI